MIAGEQDKAAALRLGANRYFEKPSDLDGFMKLGKLVKEILPNPLTSSHSGFRDNARSVGSERLRG
jgi:hypothetical protein